MSRQTVTHLNVDELTAHPDNVRTDLGDLEDMARSIREHGILQPITVTEHPAGGYLLLAGHRRLAASRLVGLSRVPVVIRHDVADTGTQLVLMLVENCQRRDLTPIEKSEAFGALRNRGLTIAEIARQVGVSPPTVSHYLALLELDPKDRIELRQGNVTATDALAMIRIERDAKRKSVGGGPVGRPKGRKTTPWFSDKHPLAKTVRTSCGHRGRPKVGNVGCGPCWEEAIRATTSTDAAPDVVHDVDQAVVQRILDGHYKTPANPAEKAEVIRRWTAGKRHVNELEQLTGWNPQRYAKVTDLGAVDQEAS